MPEWTPRSLSVVVPVFNENENVQPLIEEIVEAVQPLGLPFEVVMVDDGSSDGTVRVLRGLVSSTPELVVVSLRRNFGQTLALQAGFDRARGDAIVTMDGDLQNDPHDIPRLLEELSRGADVVSGWRKGRQDTLIVRTVPSWLANWLVRLVTGVKIHDQGCGLKAYRRDLVRRLDLYADMHRFIAILTMPLGASLVEIEVRHRPRVAGSSKYGLTRIFKVLLDLFTLQMLTRFRDRPGRWFGLLGSPFLVASLLSGTLMIFTRSGVVLSAVALLTATTSVACFLFGLLGEWVIEEASRGQARRVLFREWGRDS